MPIGTEEQAARLSENSQDRLAASPKKFCETFFWQPLQLLAFLSDL